MVACGDLDPLLLLSKFILLDTTGEHDLPSFEPERALAVLSATYRWAISIISWFCCLMRSFISKLLWSMMLLFWLGCMLLLT